MGIPYKQIIEERSFTEKIDVLKKDNARLNEVFEAISWALGRNPKLGQKLSVKDHYVYETSPLDLTEPSYWILYKYKEDEENVYLLSITAAHKENE